MLYNNDKEYKKFHQRSIEKEYRDYQLDNTSNRIAIRKSYRSFISRHGKESLHPICRFMSKVDIIILHKEYERIGSENADNFIGYIDYLISIDDERLHSYVVKLRNSEIVKILFN